MTTGSSTTTTRPTLEAPCGVATRTSRGPSGQSAPTSSRARTTGVAARRRPPRALLGLGGLDRLDLQDLAAQPRRLAEQPPGAVPVLAGPRSRPPPSGRAAPRPGRPATHRVRRLRSTDRRRKTRDTQDRPTDPREMRMRLMAHFPFLVGNETAWTVSPRMARATDLGTIAGRSRGLGGQA